MLSQYTSLRYRLSHSHITSQIINIETMYDVYNDGVCDSVKYLTVSM